MKKFSVIMSILSAVITAVLTIVALVMLFVGLLNAKEKSLNVVGVFLIIFLGLSFALSIATIVFGRGCLRDVKNGAQMSGGKKFAIISLANSLVLFAMAIMFYVRNVEIFLYISLALAIIIFVCSIILFVGIKKNQY